MICEYCLKYRSHDLMARPDLCLECEEELKEWEKAAERDMELFRCCVCKQSPPYHERLGDHAPSEPGGYVCGHCWWNAWWEMFEARRAKVPWEDREIEVDHADSQEHGEWWDAERRLWNT